MFNANDTHKIGFTIFLGTLGIIALVICSYIAGFQMGFINGIYY